MQSLLKKTGIKTVVGPSTPYIHSLKGESACHLIHLEWDLERDPDRELDELLERDLKNKKQNLSNIFLATNHSNVVLMANHRHDNDLHFQHYSFLTICHNKQSDYRKIVSISGLQYIKGIPSI